MHEKIDALVNTVKTFSEKEHQVMPAQFSVFGIEIGSRYGKCDEIIEMLSFCQAAAGASVAHYVKEVNYDSKACTCSFVFDGAVVEGGEVEEVLLHIARRTFSHFFWFDDEIIGNGTAQ